MGKVKLKTKTDHLASNRHAKHVKNLLFVAKRYQDTKPDGGETSSGATRAFHRGHRICFPVAQVVDSHEPSPVDRSRRFAPSIS